MYIHLLGYPTSSQCLEQDFKELNTFRVCNNWGGRSSSKHENNTFISKHGITFQRHRAAERPTAVDSTLSAALTHLTGRTFTHPPAFGGMKYLSAQNSDGKVVFLFLAQNKKEGAFVYAPMDLVFHNFSLD
jgi:hypothetical protein